MEAANSILEAEEKNKFYTSFSQIESEIGNITLQPLLQDLNENDAKLIQDFFYALSTEHKNTKVGIYSITDFFLVCLKELLDNKELFSAITKKFITTEPGVKELKLQYFIDYFAHRFWKETVSNGNSQLMYASYKNKWHSVGSLSVILLIQKNHYLICEKFNSTYLHDFQILKEHNVALKGKHLFKNSKAYNNELYKAIRYIL